MKIYTIRIEWDDGSYAGAIDSLTSHKSEKGALKEIERLKLEDIEDEIKGSTYMVLEGVLHE